MQSPVPQQSTAQGQLQPPRWGGQGLSAAAVRRSLLTLGCSRLVISRHIHLPFHIIKAFGFCPERFVIKHWEKHTEQLIVVHGAGAASLSPYCCYNPLIHFNPITSPCGYFQFWPLKK